MSIKRMQYDVKVKLNKIDSQQYRNLLVPELDWALNEAMNIFIKMIAQPRTHISKQLFDFGFEKNQRNVDDIRTIVIDNEIITTTKLNDKHYQIALPSDYMYLVGHRAFITKGKCKNIEATSIQRQHDDKFENSPFDKSSFEWREVNFVFYEDGIKLFSDGTFSIDSMSIDYIRQPLYIHNAEDFSASQYNLPDGTLLTGYQDCELPIYTHSEIVDIAVLILSGQLQYNDYNIKKDKLNITN